MCQMPMNGLRILAVVAVLVLWQWDVRVVSTVDATFQQQVFRSGVHTVEVYATVTDRTGRLITDLTRADFEMFDNGRPQPVTVFVSGVQPITAAVMIDESPSLFESAARITDAMYEFARSFLPGDRAALGGFSHVVRLEPRFSSRFTAQLNDLPLARPRFPSGTALWDALNQSAEQLAAERGRRVILVLTDAEDNCSRVDPEDVRDRIELDGTMVYAIGVRGDGGLQARALRDLSRDSGGYYFELRSSDDLVSTFRRVADELHRQYVIGFAAPELDGKPHKISVRLKRAGLTARARMTYVAPGPGGGGQ
jgi:VWFA-related protein